MACATLDWKRLACLTRVVSTPNAWQSTKYGHTPVRGACPAFPEFEASRPPLAHCQMTATDTSWGRVAGSSKEDIVVDGVTLEAKKDGCMEVQWMEFTKVCTCFMHVNFNASRDTDVPVCAGGRAGRRRGPIAARTCMCRQRQ